jgi:hypothetical protein
MSSIIELHDSCVVGITSSGCSVIIQFRPAYVHCSEGRAGFDPGSGWVQDIDLVVSEAVLVSSLSEMPQQLADGSLLVDDEVFENAIPLPLELRGVIRFSAMSLNRERLVIQGTRATAVPVGEARFVEQFPDTK